MTWLDPVEHQAWVGLLACAAGVAYASDRQLQADSGLSFQTFSILAAVSESPEQVIHMGELAGIVGHSQSRLSHAVTRLEGDGLMAREGCPSDGRAVHVRLTAEGRRVIRNAAPAHVSAVRELVFDRLTAEQTEALADVTRTIWQSLIHSGHVSPIGVLDTPAVEPAGR